MDVREKVMCLHTMVWVYSVHFAVFVEDIEKDNGIGSS